MLLLHSTIKEVFTMSSKAKPSKTQALLNEVKGAIDELREKSEETSFKVTLIGQKGGVGKTTISIALNHLTGWPIATNELNSGLGDYLPEDAFTEIDLIDEFEDYSNYDVGIIFDLSGTNSRGAKSIPSALQQSDVVIMPIEPHTLCMNTTSRFLTEVLEYVEPEKIIFVANNLMKESGSLFKKWEDVDAFVLLKDFLEAHVGESVRLLPVRNSAGIVNITDKGTSLEEQMEENRLHVKPYSEAQMQLNAILKEALNLAEGG